VKGILDGAEPLALELARASGESPVAEMSPVDAASQEVAVFLRDKARGGSR